MKTYIAHNFAARIILREIVVPYLENEGHFVTSRWIKDDESVSGTLEECANIDVDDLESSDVLILYLQQYSETPGKGKWFEFGYAYAMGKEIILIGEDSTCVFIHLPYINRAETIEDAVAYLNELERGSPRGKEETV